MNPSAQASFLTEPKETSKLRNIYLETEMGILDILSLDNCHANFEALKSRATRVELFGFQCNFLSLDDLIQIKETMTRPKDKIVLEELKEIRARNS